MKFKKNVLKPGILIGSSLALIVTIARPLLPANHLPDKFENLQVLPKEITSKELQGIMVDEFQDGLGVGCGYCHKKQENSILLDYPSDEKPEKEIARHMMRMTEDINKNYLGVENAIIGSQSMAVTCFTCHKGTAHPEE